MDVFPEADLKGNQRLVRAKTALHLLEGREIRLEDSRHTLFCAELRLVELQAGKLLARERALFACKSRIEEEPLHPRYVREGFLPGRIPGKLGKRRRAGHGLEEGARAHSLHHQRKPPRDPRLEATCPRECSSPASSRRRARLARALRPGVGAATQPHPELPARPPPPPRYPSSSSSTAPDFARRRRYTSCCRIREPDAGLRP